MGSGRKQELISARPVCPFSSSPITVLDLFIWMPGLELGKKYHNFYFKTYGVTWMRTQVLLFQGFFRIILGFLLLLSWGWNQTLNIEEILQIGRKLMMQEVRLKVWVTCVLENGIGGMWKDSRGQPGLCISHALSCCHVIVSLFLQLVCILFSTLPIPLSFDSLLFLYCV